MSSTYSTNLAIELIGTGDQAGTWGNTTNTNLGTLIEQAISGYVTQAVATGTDTTITIPNGATGVARNMYIELTGTGGTNTNLIVPANKKLYFIFNNSTGAVTVKVSGQTGVSVPQGKKMVLVSNGTDIVNGLNYIADFGTNSFTVTNLTATSASITTLTATSSNITTLSGTTATFTSASVTNLTATSIVISNLSIASANITTLTSSSATISTTLALSGGTANGVLYLNGSKVATSGSALTFDGTDLATTGGVRLNNAQYYYGKNAAGSAVRLLGINAGNVNYVGAIDSGPTEVNYGSASTLTTQYWNISGSESMRLTSTGLGIGTSSPAYKLDVAESGAPTSTNTFSVARISGSDSVANDLTLLGPNTSQVRIKFGDPEDATIGEVGYNHSTNSLRFVTNGAQVGVFDSSGNLGIGLTPNTWQSVALQGKSFGINALLGVDQTGWSTACYQSTYGLDTGWKSKGAYRPTLYAQTGSHVWYISLAVPSAANQDITWTQAMTLDTSGNLGVGVTNPAERLHVVSGANTTQIRFGDNTNCNGYLGSRTSNLCTLHTDQILAFGTGNATFTERARITSDGNLLVGTTTPQGKLTVDSGSSGQYGYFNSTNANGGYASFVSSGTVQGDIGTAAQIVSGGATTDFGINARGSRNLIFGSNNNERARITSGGNLLVGTTTDSGYHRLNKSNTSDWICAFANTSATTPWGITLNYSAAAPNNTSAAFTFADNAAERATIRNNGGLANYQANDVNLSDQRVKKDVKPLGSMWDKFKAIEIVTFKYNDQTHDDDNIGVIAQQVESVAPEFIDVDGFGETPEDGVPLKTVYTTDMYHAAIKALQEAMARIEKLEAEVSALKGA